MPTYFRTRYHKPFHLESLGSKASLIWWLVFALEVTSWRKSSFLSLFASERWSSAQDGLTGKGREKTDVPLSIKPPNSSTNSDGARDGASLSKKQHRSMSVHWRYNVSSFRWREVTWRSKNSPEAFKANPFAIELPFVLIRFISSLEIDRD